MILEELEAGFVVCMVPLVISVLVSCFEWMPTAKKLIIFIFIFKKYYEEKKRAESKLLHGKPPF